MKNQAKWFYNEFQQIGADYTSVKEVEIYDKRMGRARDFQKETQTALDKMNLKPDYRIMDIGCGTGVFAVNAAPFCKQVIAMDISRTMLAYARKKAEKLGIKNIKFLNNGFLTYEHTGKPLDAIYTSLALHHMPDFWKTIALRRLHKMLRPNGILVLQDVIFSFDIDSYKLMLNKWVNSSNNRNTKNRMVLHIKEEFSILDFIMDAILKKVGFKIIEKYTGNVYFGYYVCKK